jgi:hypothetical protein
MSLFQVPVILGNGVLTQAKQQKLPLEREYHRRGQVIVT